MCFHCIAVDKEDTTKTVVDVGLLFENSRASLYCIMTNLLC